MRTIAAVTSLALSVLGLTVAFIEPAAASVVHVPEPISALVFGAGLIGAAAVARRKKK